MWEQFSNILSIIREMEIENDQDSLTAFHHRQNFAWYSKFYS